MAMGKLAMRESKAELTDRLRREERFEAFKKRREELKTGGTAASDAWDVAAAEFPPPDAKLTAVAAPMVDLQALKGKPSVSIAQAAAWVFEQLNCDWITPADAPSPGAWSLLEWARSNMARRRTRPMARQSGAYFEGSATFTSRLPVLSPSSMPINARGSFSKPRAMSSLYFNLPSRIQPAISTEAS